MKFRLLWAMFVLIQPIFSQTTQPCHTPNHRLFDFWIGDWEVFNPSGKQVGENRIVALHEGCVVQENWKSDRVTGTSYNYYNPADSTWHQLYLDNQGTILPLKGHFADGKMVLFGDRIKSQKSAGYYRNRITWQALPEGHVSQKWEIVGDDDAVLYVAFDGVYKRKTLVLPAPK